MPAFLHLVPARLASRNRGPSGAARRPLATAVMLFAVVGLLAAFGQVVREAVHQGQLRREATARHSTASWRCASMHGLRLRDACLAELNAPPPPETLLTAPPP